MPRSPTLALLGLIIGVGGCVALLMGIQAAVIDAPSAGGLFPRGPYAVAAIGYGLASLTAAWGLWRQGALMQRAVVGWAALGSVCILWFGYAAQGRMALALANYLVLSAPFLILPWGIAWFVSREPQGARPNDR